MAGHRELSPEEKRPGGQGSSWQSCESGQWWAAGGLFRREGQKAARVSPMISWRPGQGVRVGAEWGWVQQGPAGSREALVTDQRRKEKGWPLMSLALIWGPLWGECVHWSLGSLGTRGMVQASRGLGGWSRLRGICQGPHLTGLPTAEFTQATDPTSAHILAAKRLSLSSPTSR